MEEDARDLREGGLAGPQEALRRTHSYLTEPADVDPVPTVPVADLITGRRDISLEAEDVVVAKPRLPLARLAARLFEHPVLYADDQTGLLG